MNNSDFRQNNSFSSSNEDGFIDDLSIIEKINLWWSRLNLMASIFAKILVTKLETLNLIKFK